jgi:hypothetical protein
LKSGKAAGLGGIPNEFLKFGGDIMITSLTNLFITISDLEQTPSDWQKGIIILIHKSASILKAPWLSPSTFLSSRKVIIVFSIMLA